MEYLILRLIFGFHSLVSKEFQWLDGKADKDTLVSAIKQADKECGSLCQLRKFFQL